eukprot:m.12390 g.12390  ORF g.12390 m.12390 type:complete len:341 (+) comp2941_c0_seq2:591-1613(+)
MAGPSQPASGAPHVVVPGMCVDTADSTDVLPQRSARHVDAKPSLIDNWPHFLAGTIAGGAETIFSHPIDTFKVRVQSRVHDGIGLGKTYKFGFTATEGISLFHGIGPAFARGLLSGALFLGTNEYFKKLLKASDTQPLSPAFISAATLTGIFETVIYAPFELMKTQLQVGNHRSVKKCVKSLYGKAGIRGLYMGMLPLGGSHVLGNVSFFVSYDVVQGCFGGIRETGTPSVLSTSVAGGVAGAMYYLVGHPLDTVQACVMAQRYPHEQFTSTMDCIRYLLRQQGGWRTLFRGVVPNVLQAVPGGAVSMLAFEAALPILVGVRDGTISGTGATGNHPPRVV